MGQLTELRQKWNKWLESAKGIRQIESIRRAADRDESQLTGGDLGGFLQNNLGPAIGDRETVSDENVASIILYVREGQHNILLTGDARDDHVYEALDNKGLTRADGSAHINVIKVPHHASKNNFSTDFARLVTADHYLICGNGGHGNPHLEVLQRLVESRLGRPEQRGTHPEVANRFKIWFSADEGSLDAYPDHMRDVEELMASLSDRMDPNNQMTVRFNRNRSMLVNPNPL